LYRGEALAPMVRASTTPLRVLALQYGADFVYTEELVDRSITSALRVENSTLGTIDYVKDTEKLSKKSVKKLQNEGRAPLLLRIDPKLEANKLVCQIGSGEPELALEAALHIHKDVAGIDINMGCPRKFSVSGGMGSALLGDPDRACRIVRTLTDNLTQPGVPVSAKIRLLKNSTSTVEFIDGLVNAGVKAVAIHGRRVGDEGTNPADWDTLSEVVSIAKSKHPLVPILINGDFYTREEFEKFQQKTKSDGVLLARPALYNTSIFQKPAADAGQQLYSYNSPLLIDKSTVIRDYLKLAVQYDIHHKNVKYVICEMMNSRRAPTPRVPFLPQDVYPDGQTIAKTCNCHCIQDICKVWNVDYQKHVLSGKSSSITGTEELAPAGEHRYLDSFFLDPEDRKITEPQKSIEGENRPIKRTRLAVESDA